MLRRKLIELDAAEAEIAIKHKGGHYHAKEVRDAEVKDALLNYLAATDRLHALKTDAPLWTRHDNRKLAGEQLTSHALVRNLKLYARSRCRRRTPVPDSAHLRPDGLGGDGLDLGHAGRPRTTATERRQATTCSASASNATSTARALRSG